MLVLLRDDDLRVGAAGSASRSSSQRSCEQKTRRRPADDWGLERGSSAYECADAEAEADTETGAPEATREASDDTSQRWMCSSCEHSYSTKANATPCISRSIRVTISYSTNERVLYE